MSSRFSLGRNRDSFPDVKNLTVVVSGSFHRHMEKITAVVHDFAAQSVRVLSPADPRVVAYQGEFLFVASDPIRSIKLVQDRHLDCIRAASFLWLVCPDGYIGLSAAMEIGAAREAGVPVFAAHAPNDLTLREYVLVVSSISDAIRQVRSLARPRRVDGLLIDPHASIEKAHELLSRIEAILTGTVKDPDPVQSVYGNLTKLCDRFPIPTLTH